MWGTTAGINDGMRSRWDRMEVGDLVLFLKENMAYLAATVTHKWQNAALADHLWDPKQVEAGTLSWELMFSFTKPMPVNISYDDLTAVASTGKNVATRSFSVYSAPVGDRVASLLDVDDRALLRPLSQTDVGALVRSFDEVDAATSSYRRLEQPYLRNLVIPGASEHCALCSRDIEAELLVAAHIKRRSTCTFEEKIDFTSIAMAACRFGCDELFERGYIWVDSDGTIKPATGLTDPTAIQYWEKHLQGRQVWNWSARSASHKYFEAHRADHGHRSSPRSA